MARAQRLAGALVALAIVLGAGTSVARAVNPLGLRSMWVWYVSRSDGGNVAQLAADAHRYGIGTLMIKSSDGTNGWSQFNSTLVRRLHAYGLHVCAWQYVYGNSPMSEALLGVHAVHQGADCLLIDAEGEYEGKYVSAQTYVKGLRHRIGSRYPVALAGLPYVDYHPGFPYSVFLGPGAANYNAPQMYWSDIGTSVDAVYRHTYAFNRLYERTIIPLGDVSSAPRASDIVRFRQDALAMRAPSVSWWDWQEASGNAFAALAEPIGLASNAPAVPDAGSLGLKAQGDVVVWAQEHLAGAGIPVTVDGDFGPGTRTAVQAFQRAHGLTADGVIGQSTWHKLVHVKPVSVTWTARGAVVASAARAGDAVASAVQAGRAVTLPVPSSAHLPDRGHEFRRAIGRG